MTQKQYDHFIAGEWRSSSRYLSNQSPADLSDIVGDYAMADAEQVEQALQAAQAAQAEWRATGLEQRKAVLDFIGDELIARKEELGRLLCREEGKTLAEGMGEVARAGQFFQYYAAECLRQIGDFAQSVRPNVDIEVHRDPVGTVAVITPWNFPTAVAAWKIAPALAYGNSVVLKPSELTPASAWALAEIISRSGLTAGAFNLVMGDGATTGQALAGSPLIDAVSFTGSVATGRAVAQQAIGNMAKIQLEMGSKNALFVTDQAEIDTAVNCAINGAFFGSGQKCTASSRLIVDASVHDEFVDKFVSAARALVVGHPFDAQSQIGSMASQAQFNKVLAYIESAQTEGAELFCGGKALELEHEGYYLSPTVFANTSNAMQVNREEVFGPLTCIIKADNFEHGVELTNDTEFGLTAGVVTGSLKQATEFKKSAQAGCVMVNLPTAGTDYHVPFGGRGASSYGPREQGQYAKEFYTTVKTVYQTA